MTLRRDKKKESLTRKMLEHERYLLNLIKPIPHSCRFIHSEGKVTRFSIIRSILLKSVCFSEEKTYLFFFLMLETCVCNKYFFLHDKIYIVESGWKKPNRLSSFYHFSLHFFTNEKSSLTNHRFYLFYIYPKFYLSV